MGNEATAHTKKASICERDLRYLKRNFAQPASNNKTEMPNGMNDNEMKEESACCFC